MARVVVIGAGFSGLSAASYLSAAGHEVQVYEKNETAGGRARQLITSMDIYLIWDPAGTGCRIYLSAFLTISATPFPISMN